MNKKRSVKLFNKLCNLVGKIIVFTGIFAGMFFLINIVCNFLEPYVVSATDFCISNVRWISIGVSCCVVSVLGFIYFIDNIKAKRLEKVSINEDEEDYD